VGERIARVKKDRRSASFASLLLRSFLRTRLIVGLRFMFSYSSNRGREEGEVMYLRK